MPEREGNFPGTPTSRTVPRSRTRLSLVWLIPIVAAVAAAWVTVTRILGEGPKITIVVHSAEGLEAGKTKIEANGVQVGVLTDIRLSEDHSKAIATAQMAPNTERFLVEDTKLWVVRPRISGASVTGLGTLLSGSYIGMEIGASKKARRSFEALAEPPVVRADTPGRSFELSTASLGSIDNGTPIFFRHLKVGEVASYRLEENGQGFRVEAFVKAPYDQYVTPATRFWHASGIDVSLGATGLKIQTESIVSILIGGIAFETPATGPVLAPAQEGTSFTLFEDRSDAFKPAARDPQKYVAVFDQPVRGLVAGAPVDFRGIPIGEVSSVEGRLDAKTRRFEVRVGLRLDAERFGVEVVDRGPSTDRESARRKLVDALVAQGARAQLRTGSLLTGALYVAIDFFPDAPSATVDWSQEPPRLPTVPGQLGEIEKRVADIVKKLEQVPFEEIGDDLRKAIVELDRTLVSARGTFDDAGSLVEPNSAFDQRLEGTLQEVSGAARAVRLLADYLERHPEALLRGKTGEAR